MTLNFTRCRNVWVPDDSEAGGFWSPPPPHVRYGVEKIVKHPWFLLADDMGGMKTAQAIIAAQFLHDMDIIDRVIVVAPASVRPKVWYDEDLGQLREQVFEDKNNYVTEYHQKLRHWQHGPSNAKQLRWIVTNYEYLRPITREDGTKDDEKLNTLLPYCGPRTMLVLDESNAVRTWDSAQTKACMALRWMTNRKGLVIWGMPRCGRILEMNGTPVAESPMDMFSQANLLHPSVINCRYITHYKARYAIQTPVLERGKPMVKYGKVVQNVEGWTNLEDLQRRIAPYVLRREAKELGIDFALPPVGLEVRLTEKTWKHYTKMRDDLCIWLESGVATAATAAVKSIRLSQITSGFVGGIEFANIGEGSEGYEGIDFFGVDATSTAGPQTIAPVQEIGREKLDFALGWHADLLLSYPNMKLLTWCRFVPELKRYLKEERLTFPGVPVGAACGQKVLDDMQSQKDEREFALRLLHPKTAPQGPATVGATQGTGALGLNFTACHTVLDMSFDFSPWKKKQGDARVNRPGQTGPVSFFYLVAVGPKGQKTIDHHVMMTRLGKANVNEWTMAGWVKKLMEE